MLIGSWSAFSTIEGRRSTIKAVVQKMETGYTHGNLVAIVKLGVLGCVTSALVAVNDEIGNAGSASIVSCTGGASGRAVLAGIGGIVEIERVDAGRTLGVGKL